MDCISVFIDRIQMIPFAKKRSFYQLKKKTIDNKYKFDSPKLGPFIKDKTKWFDTMRDIRNLAVHGYTDYNINMTANFRILEDKRYLWPFLFNIRDKDKDILLEYFPGNKMLAVHLFMGWLLYELDLFMNEVAKLVSEGFQITRSHELPLGKASTQGIYIPSLHRLMSEYKIKRSWIDATERNTNQ